MKKTIVSTNWLNKVIAIMMMMSITFAMPAMAGNKKNNNGKKQVGHPHFLQLVFSAFLAAGKYLKICIPDKFISLTLSLHLCFQGYAEQ